MDIMEINTKSFESARNRDLFKPEANVHITDAPNGDAAYAHTPDGIGFYWYDSLQDLADQHS